jgi:carbon storage regulator
LFSLQNFQQEAKGQKMLVLTRRENEMVLIPQLNISIRVNWIRGDKVSLAFDAPKEVRIIRAELEEACQGQ